MFYRSWVKETVVIDADWPLSLGYQIAFYSTNKRFVGKDHFITKKQVRNALKHKHDLDGTEGYAMSWGNNIRMRAIAIFYQGECRIRFLELISHEVSHIVDHIFETAGIKKIDTELRAYMIDWIVGKILHVVKLDKPVLNLKKTKKKAKKTSNKKDLKKDKNK